MKNCKNPTKKQIKEHPPVYYTDIMPKPKVDKADFLFNPLPIN